MSNYMLSEPNQNSLRMKWNIYKHVRIKQLNIFSIVEFRDYFLLEQTEFSFVQIDCMFK